MFTGIWHHNARSDIGSSLVYPPHSLASVRGGIDTSIKTRRMMAAAKALTQPVAGRLGRGNNHTIVPSFNQPFSNIACCGLLDGWAGPDGISGGGGGHPQSEPSSSIMARASSLAGSISARFRQGLGGGGNDGAASSSTLTSTGAPHSPGTNIGSAMPPGSVPPPPFGQLAAPPSSFAPAGDSSPPLPPSYVPPNSAYDIEGGGGGGPTAFTSAPAYAAPETALAAAQQVCPLSLSYRSYSNEISDHSLPDHKESLLKWTFLGHSTLSHASLASPVACSFILMHAGELCSVRWSPGATSTALLPLVHVRGSDAGRALVARGGQEEAEEGRSHAVAAARRRRREVRHGGGGVR